MQYDIGRYTKHVLNALVQLEEIQKIPNSFQEIK